MNTEEIKHFEELLFEEDNTLSELLEKQKNFRKSVTEKKWDSLVKVTDEINFLSDKFMRLDIERDLMQKELSPESLNVYTKKIIEISSKLSTFKIENKAISDYIEITKDFLSGVLELSPCGRNKTYSKTGKILQKQPTSVVLNINY